MSLWLFVAVQYSVRGVLHFVFVQIQQAFRVGDAKADRRGVAMLEDLRAAKGGYLVTAVVGNLTWLLFAAALSLTDPSVATVVFEFWPIFFGLYTMTGFWRNKMLDDAEREDRRLGSMLVLLVVGSVGVALVVFSNQEAALSDWTLESALGVLLALAAGALSAAADINAAVMGVDQHKAVSPRDRTSVSSTGNAAAQLILVPVFLIIGLAVSGDSGWGITTSGLLLALCAGFFHAIGAWAYLRAIHLATDDHGHKAAGITTLYYLTPVAALLLLAGFAGTDIVRTDRLIAGAAGVVAVNMVLHLDPEGVVTRLGRGGYGYRALVLALWGSGVMVLFRDDWLFASWQVWSVVEYWGILGLLATVFILVYSFRQSRVEVLRRDSDELMLRLHHQFDVIRLHEKAILTSEEAAMCMSLLREIDEKSGQSFNKAYLDLRRLLASRTANAPNVEQAKRCSGLLIDVERLVGLRQQGRGFAEPAVLAMFAVVTAALAIVARPEAMTVPFARWIHDSVSVTIAAAFLFLGFDLVDKRREADTPVFREVGKTAQVQDNQPPGWRLELATWEDRRVPQIITAGLGAVLLIGAIAMLGVKWMA